LWDVVGSGVTVEVFDWNVFGLATAGEFAYRDADHAQAIGHSDTGFECVDRVLDLIQSLK
tara:strand:- start:2575 stop:2754 length:180 start_codon:yes stop_codon:yes gene_type:complete